MTRTENSCTEPVSLCHLDSHPAVRVAPPRGARPPRRASPRWPLSAALVSTRHGTAPVPMPPPPSRQHRVGNAGGSTARARCAVFAACRVHSVYSRFAREGASLIASLIGRSPSELAKAASESSSGASYLMRDAIRCNQMHSDAIESSSGASSYRSRCRLPKRRHRHPRLFGGGGIGGSTPSCPLNRAQLTSPRPSTPTS